MNLQARKLDLIEYLIQINDEKVIDQIEDLFNTPNLKLFSREELISRASLSNLEYQSDRFKMQEKLEIDFKRW